MKLAYYPGCVAQSSGKELDMATRWVCRALGIELVAFPSFSCCGSGTVDEANEVLNVALNARNLGHRQEGRPRPPHNLLHVPGYAVPREPTPRGPRG